MATIYKRIVVRRKDKERIPETHDAIYNITDEIFNNFMGTEKLSHKSALDSPFYVNEIADNFLKHDSQFFSADIDIWLEENLNVTIQISHDGIDFDPIEISSKCPRIRAAAERLTVSSQTILIGAKETKKITIKYNLNGQSTL